MGINIVETNIHIGRRGERLKLVENFNRCFRNILFLSYDLVLRCNI